MNKLSLTSHQEVQKHCMNDSPAKISFRFPQTKRFEDTNPECPVAFYAYNSQLSKKKVIIGTSKKIEYNTKITQTPSSADYNSTKYHQFTKHRGKSFGTSRQKVPSYLKPQIHHHPCSSTYQKQKMMHLSSSFTMRSKTIDVIQKNKSFKNNPGPGEYQSIDLIRDKKEILISRFKGPKLGVFSKSHRFHTTKSGPGVHHYNKIDQFSPSGKYIVSSHRGEGTRPFTQQRRFRHQHWKINQNPGPSDYIKPSDFGIYGNHLQKYESNII